MPAQAWREVALPAFVIDVHRTLYVSGSMRVTLQERPQVQETGTAARGSSSVWRGTLLVFGFQIIHAKRTPVFTAKPNHREFVTSLAL